MSLYSQVFRDVPATSPPYAPRQFPPPPPPLSLPPKKHTSASFLLAVRTNLCHPWLASFLFQVACYYSNFDVLRYHQNYVLVTGNSLDTGTGGPILYKPSLPSVADFSDLDSLPAQTGKQESSNNSLQAAANASAQLL